MGLSDRWYMRERASNRQTRAGPRRRMLERVVDFDPFQPLPDRPEVARNRRRGPERLRQYLARGVLLVIGIGMVVAPLALLWHGQTVAVDLNGMVSEVSIWLEEVKERSLDKAADWLYELRSHERTAPSHLRFGRPSSAIVKVELTSGGIVHECGGAVVSRNKVLTAAHCLTDKIGRSVPGRLRVTPISDLGWRHAPWEVTGIVTEGFNYRTLKSDIAVLIVRPDAQGVSLGDVTGWFGRSSSRLRPLVLGRIGPVGVHRREVCSRVLYVGQNIVHDCFSEPGASGSPVFHVDETEGQAYIVGIHSASDDTGARGTATRLTGGIWNLVEREVSSDSRMSVGAHGSRQGRRHRSYREVMHAWDN